MIRFALPIFFASLLVSVPLWASLEDAPLMGNLEAPGAFDVEPPQPLLNEFVVTEFGGGLSGTMSSERSSMGLALSGEYHRTLNSLFQLGGALGYSLLESELQSSTSRTSALSVSALGTLNFGSSPVSAFFLRGQVGRSFAQTSSAGRSSDSSRSLFEARLGKRFEITEQVSFAPHVYVGSWFNEAGSSFVYGVRLLSASLHW